MRRAWSGWIVSAAAVCLVSCSGAKGPAVNAVTPVAAAPAAPAASQPVPEEFQASGPLVVENQVDVATQREGVVAKIVADVGTRVRKGDVLVLLDNRQLTANRDAAKAKADGMAADYEHWVADLKLRQSDLSRAEQMWKAQLITQQALDHDRYSVESGKFFLQRQAKDLDNAKAELASAELELAKARIVAPFDGIVARRYVNVGQKVAMNDRIEWVTATAPLNVRFTLPQEYVGRVSLGDKVQIAPSFNARDRHEARIRQISPVIDPASGTFEVQAQVVGAPGELRPGMTVNIGVRPK